MYHGCYNKYINNTGGILLEGNPQDIVKKAQSFVHFTYVKSGEQLMVVDIQGNESTLTDSEIATRRYPMKRSNFFCSENISS